MSLIKEIGIRIGILNGSEAIANIQKIKKEVQSLQNEAGNIRIAAQKASQKANAVVNVAKTAQYSDKASILVNAVKDRRIAAKYGMAKGGLRNRAQERLIAQMNEQHQTSPTADQLMAAYDSAGEKLSDPNSKSYTKNLAAKQRVDIRDILAGKRVINPDSVYDPGKLVAKPQNKSYNYIGGITDHFTEKINNDGSAESIQKLISTINKGEVGNAAFRTEIAKKAQKKIDEIRNGGAKTAQKVEKEITKTVKTELEKRVDAEEDAADEIGVVAETAEEKAKRLAKEAQMYFQMGFSMHILQVYALPIINLIKYISTESLKVFAEFDKKFVDYVTKSADYASSLTRTDFYDLSKGQTFGLTNSAITAERFAASGIDVAKSQGALTKTMQVATLANLDYDKTANGVIRTLQAMHMQVGQTATVTDSMINAANASSAELSDLVDWFEYSASSAYQLGLNVQDLSKYLGILSSTGTPGTGAAARQLFTQLMKTSVQKNLMEKYSFLNETDFTDFNVFIEKMRNAAQASGDIKAFTTEALRAFEGRPNAQQAFMNLMSAEPELWNTLTAAVAKTGTTEDLYNKSTMNTADALKRVATNLEIIQVQFGGVFAFMANVLATLSTSLVTITTILPGPIRKFIGLIILGAGAVGLLISALLGMAGGMAVARGATRWLQAHELKLSLTTSNVRETFRELWYELKKNVLANYEVGKSINYVKGSMDGLNRDIIIGAKPIEKWQGAFSALSGGMIGYSIASEFMQKNMFAEAEVVNLLTGAYMTLQLARGGGIPGVLAGVGVFVGYETLMNQKMEDLKREQRIARLQSQTGPSNINKTFNINVNSLELQNANADDFEEFTNQVRSGSVDSNE